MRDRTTVRRPPAGGPARALAAAVTLLAALALALAAADATAATGHGRLANPDAPAASRPSLPERVGSSPISARKLKRKLARLARRAPGASGFYVYDIDARRKRVLFARSAGKRRLLASNEKLFTTTTALATLGADDRLVTRVKAAGKISGAGVLKGDLYLVGDGDPSLGAAAVADLAGDVRRSGIKRVRGTVYGDDSIFDRRRGVPDSNWGPSPYLAPLSGLVYGGSTYREDPAKEAARAFRDALRGAGVKVGGKVKVRALPGKLRGSKEIGSWRSDPIATLVAATNKPSNNFYAEMLLKRLDAKRGHRGTTRGGAGDVERYARGLGAKVDARDGSGLTRHNRSSPRDIVRLLTAVRDRRGVGKPLFKSLSIAAKDGTLAGRMGGTAAAGRCRGKTGTISGVSNLSGYCRSGHGLVAFSLLMNGVGDLGGAHYIQDKMAVQIARYRR